MMWVLIFGAFFAGICVGFVSGVAAGLAAAFDDSEDELASRRAHPTSRNYPDGDR